MFFYGQDVKVGIGLGIKVKMPKKLWINFAKLSIATLLFATLHLGLFVPVGITSIAKNYSTLEVY